MNNLWLCLYEDERASRVTCNWIQSPKKKKKKKERKKKGKKESWAWIQMREGKSVGCVNDVIEF